MSYYITMEETTCKPILDELAKDNMVQLERPMISEMQKGGNYFGGGFVLYPTDASPVCMYFNMAVNTIEAPIYVLTVEPAKDAYTLSDNKMGKGLLCTDKILVTNAECLNTDFIFDRFVECIEDGSIEQIPKDVIQKIAIHFSGVKWDPKYNKVLMDNSYEEYFNLNENGNTILLNAMIYQNFEFARYLINKYPQYKLTEDDDMVFVVGIFTGTNLDVSLKAKARIFKFYKEMYGKYPKMQSNIGLIYIIDYLKVRIRCLI